MNDNNDSESAHIADSARPSIEGNHGAPLRGSPYIGDRVYNGLPDLLKIACSVFKTKRERDAFLTGALAILSGCFGTVEGVYDGRRVNANLFSFVIAPPASGKGVLIYAKELGMGIHRRLTAQNDEALKSYKATLRKYKASCKAIEGYELTTPAPEEPTIKLLFLPANSSMAAMMRHIQQNDGCGILCETEADTLTNALKQEWGNFDDLLRKAFHQEAVTSSRKADNEFVEINRPQPSVALSGTPGQASKLLVSGENGLVSRFVFYVYDVPAKWRSVAPGNNVNYDNHFQKLSERVYEIYATLKNKPIEFSLSERQWAILDELFDERLSKANDALRGSVVRLGLVAFKIAMVLSVLRREQNIPVDGKLECDDTDLHTALLLSKTYQVHANIVYQEMLPSKQKGAENIRMRFFESLPSGIDFSRKEALQVGIALGISERQVDNYLRQMSESGALQLIRHGTYLKP